MDVQTIYQETIKFAARRHGEQKQIIPGTDLPYLVHLANVAMEVLMAAANTPQFNAGLAVQLALLHDTLEDTNTSYQELESRFGKQVADGVFALTKDPGLPGDKKMQDSLDRIKQQPKEVWAVKLADRITNLQKPPLHWSIEKIEAYRIEAALILQELKGGNVYLEDRLGEKIWNYNQD